MKGLLSDDTPSILDKNNLGLKRPQRKIAEAKLLEPTPQQTANFEMVFSAGLPASYVDFGPRDSNDNCRILIVGEEKNFYFNVPAEMLHRQITQEAGRILLAETKAAKKS